MKDWVVFNLSLSLASSIYVHISAMQAPDPKRLLWILNFEDKSGF